MNFKIINGTLNTVEQKDVLQMLKSDIGMAFHNQQSYKLQDSNGDIKVIKIGTKAPVKGYHYRNVTIEFNLDKKKSA